jgi:hypothetical protein
VKGTAEWVLCSAAWSRTSPSAVRITFETGNGARRGGVNRPGVGSGIRQTGAGASLLEERSTARRARQHQPTGTLQVCDAAKGTLATRRLLGDYGGVAAVAQVATGLQRPGESPAQPPTWPSNPAHARPQDAAARWGAGACIACQGGTSARQAGIYAAAGAQPAAAPPRVLGGADLMHAAMY